jgi:cell pole-organizing protein PopZ
MAAFVESDLATRAQGKAPRMGQGGLMSAIDSNSSDGDLEAIHRAQRAHEPSMEEILASIRNIIADEPAKGGAPKPLEPTPQIVYSRDLVAPRDDASEPLQRPEANGPTVVWRRPRAIEAESAAPAEDAPPRNEETLLSPEADEAVALSFGALSAGLDVRSAALADGMVREMLRPMLRQWLEDNLPEIAERLVRAEIERIARGRK